MDHNNDRLDAILNTLTILQTDMLYVKEHMDSTKDQSVRLALVENKVLGLTKIAWKIGTVCGTAILLAVLALII